jgi:hypothetical protein
LTGLFYSFYVRFVFNREGNFMDWARAIKRNREPLVDIVAALFALLGLTSGGSVGRIPRRLYYDVLRVLRPAEYAVRRLIVIAARGLVVKLPPSRPMPQGRSIGRGGRPRNSFQLFDPRKRFNFDAPPVSGSHGITNDPRGAATPAPPFESHVNAKSLCRRLEALKLALADLPRQAKRLARWRARREKMPAPKFRSPIRPGRPPGTSSKPVHGIEIGGILADCHSLAFDAMRPDTS